MGQCRSSHPEVFCKKGVLRNFVNSQQNTCAESCNFIKEETLAQMFSCEFFETSKNTFFTKHFRTTVSLSNRKTLDLYTHCKKLRHQNHKIFPSCKNQLIDLHCKLFDWFLYDGNIDVYLQFLLLTIAQVTRRIIF